MFKPLSQSANPHDPVYPTIESRLFPHTPVSDSPVVANRNVVTHRSTQFANGLMGSNRDNCTNNERINMSTVMRLACDIRDAFFPATAILKADIRKKINNANGDLSVFKWFTVKWVVHMVVITLFTLFLLYKTICFAHVFGVEYARFTYDQTVTRELHKGCVDPKAAISDTCGFQRKRLAESAILVSFDHAINQVLNDTAIYVWIGQALRQLVYVAAPWMYVSFPIMIVVAVMLVFGVVSHLYKTTVRGITMRGITQHRMIQQQQHANHEDDDDD